MPRPLSARASTRLAPQVVEALRRYPPAHFSWETYGPGREIVEAWEGERLAPDHPGVTGVIITGVGYERPRTDWRARGITPPRGYHRSGEVRRPGEGA